MNNTIFTRTIGILTVILVITSSTSTFADSLKINKTGTIYQNVKTSTEKGVVTVDFEDGSQKKFRTKDVTVTASEVVWLAEEVEEPSFFAKLFGGGDSKESNDSNDSTENQEKSGATTAASEADSEEESSIPYLGEGIFGGVALLFLLLP